MTELASLGFSEGEGPSGGCIASDDNGLDPRFAGQRTGMTGANCGLFTTEAARGVMNVSVGG